MTLDRLASDPRVTVRTPGTPDTEGEAVVYWMQRALRAHDNPALDIAIELGNLLGKPVVVFFAVHPFVTRANLRHYTFLVEGLPDLTRDLRRRRVGFALRGYPAHHLLSFLTELTPAILIGDENPLRQQERWRERVAEQVRVPFWTVDADVVVPSALLETEQYAARTIRPRLHKHLAEFLTAGAEPAAHVSWGRRSSTVPAATDLLAALPIDRRVGAGAQRGGYETAHERLRHFIAHGLGAYNTRRNHPEVDGTSQLSAYLHFGQLGPREVARAIMASGAPAEAVEAYLEQLIVRRELAVNYVRFNDAYDRLDGCERWARQTLRQHRFDARPHLYRADQFEAAATHDPLWNASQRQLVSTGWMHGYVRMYWAKKILEWSATPEEAFETAVTLNDRYELDGRDPNGYANIAWAIGGKHDRPWPPRPVYGTIRSMSSTSTSRKFDAARYIAQYDGSTHS
jgi:deoxyribodipyrimidine photo-lyase